MPLAKNSVGKVASLKKRTSKKEKIPLLQVSLYAGAFVVVVAVAAAGYKPNTAEQAVQLNSQASSGVSLLGSEEATTAPAVDKIISSDVAATLAEQANLPIAPNIASAAVSLQVQSEIAQSESSTVVKQQIVQPTSGDRTVTEYVAKQGDSVQTVAEANGISADTLRWANNLTSDNLTEGQKLTILPVDGIVYSYKDGDNLADVASKYGADASRITSYNDLELTKPADGQKLIIPGGALPVTERPGYVAPRPAASYGYGGQYQVSSARLMATAGNRYAFGNCTWYAYERRAQLGRPVGSFWGDGGSWYYSARAIGYETNQTPRAGAVMVTIGSPGHVAIVERVNDDGGIFISEMNYAGNFNRVTTRTVSAGQATSGYYYVHDRLGSVTTGLRSVQMGAPLL